MKLQNTDPRSGELEKVISLMEARARETMPEIKKVFIEAEAVARTVKS